MNESMKRDACAVWWLFHNIFFGIIPQLGELFHLLWRELVQPLWHWPHLGDLMGHIVHYFLRHVLVRVNMESSHLGSSLQAAVHVVVAGLPDDERRVPSGHPMQQLAAKPNYISAFSREGFDEGVHVSESDKLVRLNVHAVCLEREK